MTKSDIVIFLKRPNNSCLMVGSYSFTKKIVYETENVFFRTRYIYFIILYKYFEQMIFKAHIVIRIGDPLGVILKCTYNIIIEINNTFNIVSGPNIVVFRI